MEKTKHSITLKPEDLEGRNHVWIDFGIDRGLVYISFVEHSGDVTCWINKRIKNVRRPTYRY